MYRSYTYTARNQLIPIILPIDADNKTLTWESSNTEVVIVDSNGVVTAVGNGTVTITVKTVSGDRTATCAITVIFDGMHKASDGKWYYTDGIIDTSFTGLATNEYGTWYLKNGRIDTTFSGTLTIGDKTYTIKNGKVV